MLPKTSQQKKLKLLKIGRLHYLNLDAVLSFQVLGETQVRVCGAGSDFTVKGEDARWLISKLDGFAVKTEEIAQSMKAST